MRACSKKTFGAFHEGTWAGNGYDNWSKANFLFKLGDSLEKFPNKGSGKYAAKDPAYWPTFGGGWDLGWGYYSDSYKPDRNNGTLGAGTGAECIDINSKTDDVSYRGHARNEICGGNGNWGTTHLEVWRLA